MNIKESAQGSPGYTGRTGWGKPRAEILFGGGPIIKILTKHRPALLIDRIDG